ncbi:MAG: TM2 domain-containing protein [Clostridia bacterium]|nr:TM2 domain-containing protein [Clostridia bacterium]
MDKQRVEIYMATNREYFEPAQAMILKEKLLEVEDSKFEVISMLDLKNPTTMLIISIFLGSFGVDRFMLGDTGMGVLKLLTGGVCGILTIIDWFSVSKKAKEKNFSTIMQML